MKFRKVESYDSCLCYQDEKTGYLEEAVDGGHDFSDLDDVAENCVAWCTENGYKFQWIVFTPSITYQLEE